MEKHEKVFLKRHWTLFLVILLILALPYIFTRDALFGISFSNTGNIGDTIGGITAPFVGLVSIILLYITLYEQLKINRKQTNDSDFNKILNLQNQIQDKSSNLTFMYDTDRRNEARGLFSLVLLNNTLNDTSMPSTMYRALLRQVKLIDNSIHQFLKINYNSYLDTDTKLDFYNIAEAYANEIIAFYDLTERNVITIFGHINELDAEPDAVIIGEDGKPLNEDQIKEYEKRRNEANNPMNQPQDEEVELKKRLIRSLKTYKIIAANQS